MKTTERTAWPCSAKELTRRQLLRSHKRALLSLPPVASQRPSGLKARQLTPRGWATSGVPRAFPVNGSQKCTVLSEEQEAALRPSGLKAGCEIPPVCPRARRYCPGRATSQRSRRVAPAELEVAQDETSGLKAPA